MTIEDYKNDLINAFISGYKFAMNNVKMLAEDNSTEKELREKLNQSIGDMIKEEMKKRNENH